MDTSRRRLPLFDIVRGLAVVSMVGFHAVYDLSELYGVDIPWFSGVFEDVWRASISWTFLFVAGIMCSFSHDNMRRGLRYLAVALALWIATSLAALDAPISFGIVYCMGASTLIYAGLAKAKLAPSGVAAATIFAICFFVFYGLPFEHLGMGPLAIPLPHALYRVQGLSWLGIPAPRFLSGDYYPLLPYSLLYLAGAAMGARWKTTGYPEAAYRISCRPLELAGQHPLSIYLIHQPALIGLFALIFQRLPL